MTVFEYMLHFIYVLGFVSLMRIVMVFVTLMRFQDVQMIQHVITAPLLRMMMVHVNMAHVLDVLIHLHVIMLQMQQFKIMFRVIIYLAVLIQQDVTMIQMLNVMMLHVHIQ